MAVVTWASWRVDRAVRSRVPGGPWPRRVEVLVDDLGEHHLAKRADAADAPLKCTWSSAGVLGCRARSFNQLGRSGDKVVGIRPVLRVDLISRNHVHATR
jgi:hypothetical protein